LQRTARESAATKLLEKLVCDGATARSKVGVPGDSVSVYLLHGVIVAAESDRDAEHYGRMVSRQRLAPTERIEAILEEASDREVFGLLFSGVPDSAAERILAGRFHEVLCEFVGHHDEPEVISILAPFVDNIQIGHDTSSLIAVSCRMWDTATALDLNAVLVRGSHPPADPMHRVILTSLGDAALTVEELLDALPLESIAARACLLDMLQLGSVMVPVDDDDQPFVEDAATDAAPRNGGARLEEIPLALLAARIDSDLDLPDSDLDSPRPPVLRLEEQAPYPPTSREDTSDPTVATRGAGDLSSLKAWLNHPSVDADEMEAFDDHDYSRGNDGDGKFSTDSHNLDRIEVAALGSPTPPVKPSRPTARFSAPVLPEAEALEKINVTADVLYEIAHAFDEAEGAGRGRAVLQLLVDGSPARFAPILAELRVGRDGRLPAKDMLTNLMARPSTEHRQLLNQTLLDLIERALSAAADALSDELFDGVLERVAGYRQRMGR
jgi:hypothetical protein